MVEYGVGFIFVFIFFIFEILDDENVLFSIEEKKKPVFFLNVGQPK